STREFWRDSFTFERKSVLFGRRRAKRFSCFFYLLISWRFGEFLARRQRIVRYSRSGPGDRLVDRFFVRAGADLFPVLSHDSHLLGRKRAIAVDSSDRLLRLKVPPPIY